MRASSFPGELFHGRLSPVGEPIELRTLPYANTELFPESYRALLLNSGTAALSLAMSIAASTAKSRSPEVILPAYGCPDLLAAAYAAGLQPVLVDIQADSPRYQEGGLGAAITANTVAIVAVNFLGIAEDLPSLRILCDTNGLVLIEDNAQYFPLENANSSYSGDLVVHSFGRGKPVSQVGGGALLLRPSIASAAGDIIDSLPLQQLTERSWRLKARLFNLVLQPHVYRLLSLLPFLHIGVTRYHALQVIERMDFWRDDYIKRNVELFRKRSRQLQQQVDAKLEAINTAAYINLPRLLQSLQQPLLRYPIVCRNKAHCDGLFAELEGNGLGASRMYQLPLPSIDSIPHPISGTFAGAEVFSGRLLTLPLTSFVDRPRLEKMFEILEAGAG
jgi:dTDP-4-amino-4,6-dideoxygalactose transaminase